MQVRVFAGQEVFVLIEKIDLAPQALAMPVHVVLGFLQAAELPLDLLLLTLELTELVLELPCVVLRAIQLTALLVEMCVLLIELLQV